MPVPANITYGFVVQDIRGFKARVEFNTFSPDLSADASVLHTLITGASALGTALQALTNAKVVLNGMHIDYIYAQEPTTESGAYQLVQQKARLDGGDGAGGFQHVEIPAPVDTLFLTTSQDNLLVVDPASAELIALQAALADASVFKTPRGGHPFQEFFGGQYVNVKPPVRRVLQGA